jgi:hypothetical protein
MVVRGFLVIGLWILSEIPIDASAQSSSYIPIAIASRRTTINSGPGRYVMMELKAPGGGNQIDYSLHWRPADGFDKGVVSIICIGFRIRLPQALAGGEIPPTPGDIVVLKLEHPGSTTINFRYMRTTDKATVFPPKTSVVVNVH